MEFEEAKQLDEIIKSSQSLCKKKPLIPPPNDNEFARLAGDNSGILNFSPVPSAPSPV